MIIHVLRRRDSEWSIFFSVQNSNTKISLKCVILFYESPVEEFNTLDPGVREVRHLSLLSLQPEFVSFTHYHRSINSCCLLFIIIYYSNCSYFLKSHIHYS